MDMTTTYMGQTLRNPLIASASPHNGDIGMLRALEDSGAAAVVLPSMFEEQITADQRHFEPSLNVYRPTVAPRRRATFQNMMAMGLVRTAISRSFGAQKPRSRSH